VLPQQYNKFVQRELDRYLKAVQPVLPKAPNPKQGWGKKTTSVALDFTPFVGTGKAFQQAIKGKDLVTGKTLSTGDRIADAVGCLLSIAFGQLYHCS